MPQLLACQTHFAYSGLGPTNCPFTKYVSCYWDSYARCECTESVEALSFGLLDGYNERISLEMLLLRGMGFGGQPFDQKDSPRGFTEIGRTTHY